MAEISSDETILAVERALGEKLNWKPHGRMRTDLADSGFNSDGAGSVYSSGSGSDTDRGPSANVEQPWCFALVQPGMADRFKVMYTKEAPRLWILDPANPNPLWYRLPVGRVQSAIRWMKALTSPTSHLVGLYFRRAARLMSCYLVGDPRYQDKAWLEIQCQPTLQSPNSLEHVFAHLLARADSPHFRILEFGAVEDPGTGEVTIRVATYISSYAKWVPGPEMTTVGRRTVQGPGAGPSSAPAARNVGQFISSCVQGRTVYITIVTPPSTSGLQEGLVQVWKYGWDQEHKEFEEHIEAVGWQNDPKVGKAVWETFQLLFDYDSRRLKIWAGWTEDECYTGEVDRNAKWKVSRFGRLSFDTIARKWRLDDRTAAGSKIRDASLYFSQACYASGSGRDVEISPASDGDYVSSRKSNYGELGFANSRGSCRLPYPPDDYLAAQGREKAAECVCIGSFRPFVKDIDKIRQGAAQMQSVPPVVAARRQSVPALVQTRPMKHPVNEEMEHRRKKGKMQEPAGM